MNEEITKDEFRTDFLVSTPDVFVGAGSVFNLAGDYFYYNVSESASEADAKALRNDWGVVLQDLKRVLIGTLESY